MASDRMNQVRLRLLTSSLLLISELSTSARSKIKSALYPGLSLMRAFLLRCFHLGRKNTNLSSQHKFHTSTVMSSSVTAAALYAVTVSLSSTTGAVPEEAKEKTHHLKNGKGFLNPWDSWKDYNAWFFIRTLGRSVTPRILHREEACS